MSCLNKTRSSINIRCSHPSRAGAAAFAFWATLLLAACPARADLILNLASSVVAATPGETVIFTGSITNTTGVALNATDMFLNFGGFDPAALADLTQLLGNPDFVLLSGHTSSTVDLFSVRVDSAAVAGLYSMDLSLEDINNHVSQTVRASLNVSGGQTAEVPEPSGFLLMATAAATLAITRIRRHKRQRAESI